MNILDKQAAEKVAAMNKSFDESVDDLRKLLNGEDNEDLEKAKGSSKKSSKASSSASESESEEAESPIKQKPESSSLSSEEQEEPKPKMKKSMSIEDMIDDDPEAKVALDVEPFLKSLVAAIDARMDDITVYLRKSVRDINKKIEGVEKLNKAQAKLAFDAAELQKSMRVEIEKIGDTPIESKSALRKSGDRFDTDGSPDVAGMSKAQILQKSLDLRIAGKLLPLDVTLIEGRLNKGLPLDARHAQILSDNMK